MLGLRVLLTLKYEFMEFPVRRKPFSCHVYKALPAGEYNNLDVKINFGNLFVLR